MPGVFSYIKPIVFTILLILASFATNRLTRIIFLSPADESVTFLNLFIVIAIDIIQIVLLSYCLVKLFKTSRS